MGLPDNPGFHPELANLCKCLRYFLGGERPTQTTRQILSLDKSRLELLNNKGGISLVPLKSLRSERVPPMLNMLINRSISSYSKASRGLFVYL